MTASSLSSSRFETLERDTPPREGARLNIFLAWTSSFLVYFFPQRAGQLWVRVTLLRAMLIALVNAVLTPLWLILVIASYQAFDQGAMRDRVTGGYVPHRFAVFADLFTNVPHSLYAYWYRHEPYAAAMNIAFVVVLTLSVVTGFVILFFVLLPFAARPGANKPCVNHTLRTVLLSTGWVHIWNPVLAAMFLLLIVYRYMPGLENYILPITLVVMGLTVWTLGSLITAVRRDYRGPGDFPKPHDPWCEECGYNLVTAPADGRCPECGTPVQQSMGVGVRPLTPWERRPTLANMAAIVGQLRSLFRRPRTLFFAMPTLDGQEAAHRWLLGSVICVGLLASMILPVGDALKVFEIDWGWNLFFGSLSVGLVWAVLALMMVGIETAGIATFSRLKARSNPDPAGPGGVYLATAAKVTAYSSTLMLPWVIFGGAQLLAYEAFSDVHFLYGHHISIRVQQIVLASSLSFAHIGGLLWYELTVYRGIRAIQYANK